VEGMEMYKLGKLKGRGGRIIVWKLLGITICMFIVQTRKEKEMCWTQ
jgi:hypothetical protein